MKKGKFLLLAVIAVFMTSFITCDLLGLDEEDDPTGGDEMTVEQAKVEVRAASQQVQASVDELKNTEAGQSIQYLYDLVFGESYKSAILDLYYKDRKGISSQEILNILRGEYYQKLASGKDTDFGTYKYNFVSDTIELVEESDDTLKIIFPANEQAYANQLLNAAFTAYNIETKDIEYTEEEWDEELQEWVTETHNETVPVNADMIFVIDNEEVFNAHYSSTLNDEGKPTEVNADFSMGGYSSQTDFNGSGLVYDIGMFFNSGSNTMTGFDLVLTYTNGLESIEKIEGFYQLPPVKFDGYINNKAIEDYQKEIEETGGTMDYDYMNSQLSVNVLHEVLNVSLGKLIVKEFIDPETNEPEPTFAILYADGSFDWLDDVINQP